MQVSTTLKFVIVRMHISMPIRASFLGVATVLVALTCPADAALKHRYSFSEGVTTNATGRTIIDSVGGRNGTVIGPAAGGGVATATATQAVLPGGPSAAHHHTWICRTA